MIRKGKAYPCFCTEEELNEIKDKSKTEGNPALWNEVEGKAEKYYIPVLKAFMEELSKINAENENIPEKMIRYLLGRYDFYKVITDDRNKTTRVEAINIAGTLNQSSGSVKSIAKIPVLKMPTQFYHIGFKPGSDNTIEVVCDEGWQISMRIHSASSRIEPSLKFDVRLTMNSRPSQPKNARNKNVLVVGGSGSGKTRFFIKPNLLQMHSSYVVTDELAAREPDHFAVLICITQARAEDSLQATIQIIRS